MTGRQKFGYGKCVITSAINSTIIFMSSHVTDDLILSVFQHVSDRRSEANTVQCANRLRTFQNSIDTTLSARHWHFSLSLNVIYHNRNHLITDMYLMTTT